ncbi:AAA family ATPase [uncultured Lamprocystis sp.]|jgi:recombinational DNA repair ATPase RecF|uniref:AAA family ATPase n=1 Tax=uncultured Lamprocystis sp. TaxID=543132 RepID=UPI0025DDC86B|nr:AAA family ATPase [uncultured Lamprocystis sp.]
MKITRIKIMNLRAIAELELDLTAGDNSPLDLVVLAGSNGCGKTSVSEHILDAVYSHERFTLLNKADPRLRLVPEEMATRA